MSLTGERGSPDINRFVQQCPVATALTIPTTSELRLNIPASDIWHPHRLRLIYNAPGRIPSSHLR